jgi:hypothetical protein
MVRQANDHFDSSAALAEAEDRRGGFFQTQIHIGVVPRW